MEILGFFILLVKVVAFMAAIVIGLIAGVFMIFGTIYVMMFMFWLIVFVMERWIKGNKNFRG